MFCRATGKADKKEVNNPYSSAVDRGDLGWNLRLLKRILTANISSYLEKLQKCRFRHAGFLNEGHGIGEIIDVITIYVQHHGFRELRGMQKEDIYTEKSHLIWFSVQFLFSFSCSESWILLLWWAGHSKGDYRAKEWK